MWARRVEWGAPEQGARDQYIPEAGATGTSKEGEDGQIGGGGKAVYSVVAKDLLADESCLEEGSGLDVRVVLLDGGRAGEDACVVILALDGLLGIADVVRIGTGLSDLFAAPERVESVTVLLLEAKVGVWPSLGFLDELSFSLFAIDDAVDVARLRTSGLFMPCECDCDLDRVSVLPTLPLRLSVLLLARCPAVCALVGALLTVSVSSGISCSRSIGERGFAVGFCDRANCVLIGLGGCCVPTASC